MQNRRSSSLASAIPVVLVMVIALVALFITSIIGLYKWLPWWLATASVAATVQIRYNGRLFALIHNASLYRAASVFVIFLGLVGFFVS